MTNNRLIRGQFVWAFDRWGITNNLTWPGRWFIQDNRHIYHGLVQEPGIFTYQQR